MEAMLKSLILSLVSHRTAAVLRWDLHFLRLRVRSATRRTRSQIAKQVASCSRPLFLNIGSGPRGVDSPHWINIDGYADNNVHHLVDLTRPLPIADSTFDGIFSEHVQEHFGLEEGTELLRECYRVLVPGGVIRMVMPDAEKVMRAYFDDPAELVRRRGSPGSPPMEAVNAYFRQRYEHQCLYDMELARHALGQAGFTAIEKVSIGEGKSPAELRLDNPKYEWESLYVEAVKP